MFVKYAKGSKEESIFKSGYRLGVEKGRSIERRLCLIMCIGFAGFVLVLARLLSGGGG